MPAHLQMNGDPFRSLKMKFTHAAMALALSGVLAGLAAQPAAAKEVTIAVASTFTTMDPYDASDTLSYSAAKSMYEGLFGFDKDMTTVSSTPSRSKKASNSTTARNSRPTP